MKLIFSLILLSLTFGFSQEYPMLESRIPKNNKRFHTFALTLKLMKERDAKIIVETGTARCGDSNCSGDGCSTLIFGEWAKENQAILYSIDIDPKALSAAENALGFSRDYVHLIQSDSVQFLQSFDHPIDFLYLDSYGFQIDNPLPSQQHHLKEIVAAFPFLIEKSVVMIDDCDLPHGGKGKLVIEYLLERGWKIHSKGYQVILINQ